MKPVYYIILALVLMFGAQDMFSQQTRPSRVRPSVEAKSNNMPSLTDRAKIKNEIESSAQSHITWEREIYRFVDLTKENNAALYYPTQPIGNRMNLFTILFKLLVDDKITAYNFIDDREVFTEAEKVNVEDLLNKYQVYFSKEGNQLKVEDTDIPSSEVTKYMIKEGYFFDAATGSFQTKVIALCPILVRNEDFGTSEDALFWVTYDDIRPYISREMIMTSNYNNSLTYTIDDYFRKQMYSGDIVKTTNLMGRSLAQEVGSEPEALKQAQDSIENQLKAFDKNLWVISNEPDTTTIVADTSNKKNAKEDKKKDEKVSKPKESKPKNSSPTKSVRRNR
ncbi:gliding motility associated protein GldN [Dysgonomonadaceae bacterium PH5-43]|nr:gliding motility associated protein GldN [Dysgonomonadaceae bacterium PH5-43]